MAENSENPEIQTTTEETNGSEESFEYIRDPILDDEKMRKMFVGGILADSKEEEIKEFFEKHSEGEVVVQMINKKDQQEKKSRFCFVTLQKSEEVDEILLKRKDLTFKGRLLDVNRAVPKDNTNTGSHEKTKKLFVANLPRTDCEDEDLKKYFDERHPPKFGTIESVQLIKKKDDQGNRLQENKGYGFVMVSSEDLADKMAIQHASFEFKGRRIELKKSVPNPDKGGRGGKGRALNQNYENYDYHSYGGYPPGYGWESYYAQGYDPYGGYGENYYNYGAPHGVPRGGARGGGARFKPY